MKPVRCLATCAVLSLALSACLPFPPVIRGPEPTRSVFVPGVVDAGEEVSPLQPTRPLPAAPAPAAESTAPERSPADASDLQGPVWQWVASTFKDGTALATGDPSRYAIEFLVGGNALVTADCNFGTALYHEEGDRLTLGAIGATKKACAADSLDSAFLAQLSRVEGFAVENGYLVLTLQDEAGQMRLAAEAQEIMPAAEPSRTPTAPRATSSPAPSRTPTAPPSATPAPSRTSTAPPSATALSVPTALLPTATEPTLPPTPVLVTASLVPPTTPRILWGTVWSLRGLYVNGQLMLPVGEIEPILEFTTDGGTVFGTTGCNSYRSRIVIDTSEVAFSDVALITRKACGATVMLQEVELVDALLGATGYQIENGLLVLTGADGESLVAFVGK